MLLVLQLLVLLKQLLPAPGLVPQLVLPALLKLALLKLVLLKLVLLKPVLLSELLCLPWHFLPLPSMLLQALLSEFFSLHPDHPQFLLYWLLILIPAVLPPQLLLLPALL